MNTNLFLALQKPVLYTKSEAEFWNDTYISEQMLKSHLNPEFEGATRKMEFVNRSVDWIKNTVPAADYPRLLDIGCGPGIYAEKLNEEGYQVTGVDFSKRSIEYAKDVADHKKLNITYRYEDYLHLSLGEQFDFCTMIYCDYGALSTKDRAVVMKNVFEHLKTGGKFLFDVFTKAKFNKCKEEQTWYQSEGNGFWRAEPFLEIDAHYKYQDYVTLNHTTIITENEITPYYIWDTYFTIQMITEEAEKARFKVSSIYGDVAGEDYSEDSETMAVLLEKPC